LIASELWVFDAHFGRAIIRIFGRSQCFGGGAPRRRSRRDPGCTKRLSVDFHFQNDGSVSYCAQNWEGNVSSDPTTASVDDRELSRRNVLVGGTTLAAAPAFGLVSAAMADAKPNIIFILADDLGWKDVGYHGSDIGTPNLDKLAQTGARLEQFYSQQICTPSRAAFMTGRYPLRYGLQMAVIPSAGR
jgi:hypothetical protein